MKFSRDHDLSEALVQLLTIQALSKGNPSVTQDLAYGLVKSGLALPILARAARVTKSWAEVGMAWAGHGAIQGTREQFEADIRRAVVSVGTTGDAEWASPLVAISTLVQSFFRSLRNISLTDMILQPGYAMPLKPNVRFSVTIGTGVGNSAGEARWTPVTSMQFESEQTMPSKALALVVVTEDLLKMGGDLATNMLSAELKNAVALATDQVSVNILTAGLSPLSSVGTARGDLKQALDAIALAQWSRPVIAVSPAMLKTMALDGGESASAGGNGPPSFPDLQLPNGGSIAGVPCIGVDALAGYPGSPSGDAMLVVDCSQVAGDSGVLDYLPSGDAGILMDTAPSVGSPENEPAAAELVSMFQTNSVALRLTRWFNLTRARPTACALVEGCNYT